MTPGSRARLQAASSKSHQTLSGETPPRAPRAAVKRAEAFGHELLRGVRRSRLRSKPPPRLAAVVLSPRAGDVLRDLSFTVHVALDADAPAEETLRFWRACGARVGFELVSGWLGVATGLRAHAGGT